MMNQEPNKICRIIKNAVDFYVKKSLFRTIDRADLEHAGKIAFWKAQKHFDPSRSASLETFTRKHIERAIQKECWKAVVGEKNAKLAISVMSVQDRLVREGVSTPESPNIDAISKNLSKPVARERIQDIFAAINATINSLPYENDFTPDPRTLEENDEDFINPESIEVGLRMEEYGFIFPAIASLLKNRNCGFLSPPQQEAFLKDLDPKNLIYKKRLALRKASSLSVPNELPLTLSRIQSDEVAVYQRRKAWKNFHVDGVVHHAK